MSTYVQDTVIPFRPRPEAEDAVLMKSLTDAIMNVVRQGDALGGTARREFIEHNLRALRSDPRFAAG